MPGDPRGDRGPAARAAPSSTCSAPTAWSPRCCRPGSRPRRRRRRGRRCRRRAGHRAVRRRPPAPGQGAHAAADRRRRAAGLHGRRHGRLGPRHRPRPRGQAALPARDACSRDPAGAGRRGAQRRPARAGVRRRRHRRRAGRGRRRCCAAREEFRGRVDVVRRRVSAGRRAARPGRGRAGRGGAGGSGPTSSAASRGSRRRPPTRRRTSSGPVRWPPGWDGGSRCSPTTPRTRRYDTTRMLAEAMRRHGLSGRGVACHARAVGPLRPATGRTRCSTSPGRCGLGLVSDPHTGSVALPVERALARGRGRGARPGRHRGRLLPVRPAQPAGGRLPRRPPAGHALGAAAGGAGRPGDDVGRPGARPDATTGSARAARPTCSCTTRRGPSTCWPATPRPRVIRRACRGLAEGAGLAMAALLQSRKTSMRAPISTSRS